MPRLSKRDRCRQVANWLRDKHPCAHPVDLRFITYSRASKRDRELLGWEEKAGGRFRITVVESTRSSLDAMLETVLHEWAHCMVAHPVHWEFRAGLTSDGRDRPRALFPHDATWGICYAALVESYHDLDPPGSKVSKAYPVRNSK